MEVLEANETQLANTEVITFLREQRALLTGQSGNRDRARSKRFLSGSVATIMLETLTSLESANNGAVAKLDEESIAEFMSQIEEFGLVDSEKMVKENKLQ